MGGWIRRPAVLDHGKGLRAYLTGGKGAEGRSVSAVGIAGRDTHRGVLEWYLEVWALSWHLLQGCARVHS